MLIIYCCGYFILTVDQLEDKRAWVRTRVSQLLLINKNPLISTIRRTAAHWYNNWTSLRYIIPINIMHLPQMREFFPWCHLPESQFVQPTSDYHKYNILKICISNCCGTSPLTPLPKFFCTTESAERNSKQEGWHTVEDRIK